MKRIIGIVFILALALVFFGCDYQPKSDEIQRQQQEKLLQEATAETGMPAMTNFKERKLLKEIYELRDQESLPTYTYIVAEMTGKLIFIGNSIGYGIPYSTEYTNPQKLEYVSGHGYFTLPQADPNGLFSPGSAAGTWVMLVDKKTGKPHPVYIEPNVVVSPFPLSTE